VDDAGSLCSRRLHGGSAARQVSKSAWANRLRERGLGGYTPEDGTPWKLSFCLLRSLILLDYLLLVRVRTIYTPLIALFFLLRTLAQDTFDAFLRTKTIRSLHNIQSRFGQDGDKLGPSCPRRTSSSISHCPWTNVIRYAFPLTTNTHTHPFAQTKPVTQSHNGGPPTGANPPQSK
jgi:hypothetical protein